MKNFKTFFALGFMILFFASNSTFAQSEPSGLGQDPSPAGEPDPGPCSDPSVDDSPRIAFNEEVKSWSAPDLCNVCEREIKWGRRNICAYERWGERKVCGYEGFPRLKSCRGCGQEIFSPMEKENNYPIGIAGKKPHSPDEICECYPKRLFN